MPKTLKDHSFFADIFRKAELNFGKPESEPYLPHKQLVYKARHLPPMMEDQKPTVSAFHDWVFILANRNAFNREQAMRLGMKLEPIFKDHVLKEIEGERERRRKKCMASFASKPYLTPEYELVFDGTADSHTVANEITALEINGKPLKGKPDLVFRDRNSRNVLIIELKTWLHQGKAPLPPFGWPNLKVQLWCYGMIDDLRDAPNVLLQGLVWESQNGSFKWPRYHMLEPWNSKDPRVHDESLELFEAFGGRYLGGTPK